MLTCTTTFDLHMLVHIHLVNTQIFAHIQIGNHTNVYVLVHVHLVSMQISSASVQILYTSYTHTREEGA